MTKTDRGDSWPIGTGVNCVKRTEGQQGPWNVLLWQNVVFCGNFSNPGNIQFTQKYIITINQNVEQQQQKKMKSKEQQFKYIINQQNDKNDGERGWKAKFKWQQNRILSICRKTKDTYTRSGHKLCIRVWKFTSHKGVD